MDFPCCKAQTVICGFQLRCQQNEKWKPSQGAAGKSAPTKVGMVACLEICVSAFLGALRTDHQRRLSVLRRSPRKCREMHPRRGRTPTPLLQVGVGHASSRLSLVENTSSTNWMKHVVARSADAEQHLAQAGGVNNPSERPAIADLGLQCYCRGQH